MGIINAIMTITGYIGWGTLVVGAVVYLVLAAIQNLKRRFEVKKKPVWNEPVAYGKLVEDKDGIRWEGQFKS